MDPHARLAAKQSYLLVPRFMRMAAFAIVLACLVVLIVVPADQYGWMAEMDATIQPGSVIDASGDTGAFTGLITAIGVMAALSIALVSRNPIRLQALLAALVVAALWAIKFT